MKKNINITMFVGILIFLLITLSTVPHLVSGEVQDRKVELNGGLVHREKMFEEYQHLAPSQIVTSEEIKIKNTGSISLKMYEKFFISLKRNNLSSKETVHMLEKYFIRAHLMKNGEIVETSLPKKWVNVKEFNSYFNEETGKEIGTLNPNDTLSLKLEVKLDESAGNEYQGALLNINFVAVGIMSISEDGLLLPDTATNSFNVILIGIMLICVGLVVFYVYKRRISDVRK